MKGLISSMATSIRRLVTDPAARATMIASIIIYAVIYPQPYKSEVTRDVPIVVVDQDGSNASRELIRRVNSSDKVQVVSIVNNFLEAKTLFFERNVVGVLMIPTHFERDLIDGKPSPVAAYGDAGYFLLYNAMMGAVVQATRSIGAGVEYVRLTSSGINPEIANTVISPITNTSIALYNPSGGYATYVIPAAFVLIVQQSFLMGIGILHAGRKPLKGIELLAAPLAYIAIYCLWIAVTQILLPFLYGIPRLGTWLNLYCVAIPFLLAVTALGFAISQVFKEREGVVFFLVVMGLPLFFLSGISWPMESIPEPIRLIALLIPSTTAISAFVQVDQMGAGFNEVADKILIELALAVGYTILALGLMKFGQKK